VLARPLALFASLFVAATAAGAFVAATAAGAEFRSTTETAVLYDAPSVRAKGLFVLGRDVPVEVIVAVEGWYKIRDATGTVAWMEKKSAADRRTVVVRANVADILANPDASAAVVFKAEQNVLLELADPSYATATPGWAKVRHRDGQTGYVRISQVWGL
jgi:SH3-like domain-containing protein